MNFIETTLLPALFRTDGVIRHVEPANGTNFTLKELYALLECDTIEVLYPDMDGAILICDENSKLSSDHQMNFVATALMEGRLFPGDYVAGHALLCPDEMLK
jgi:hypothetical protein